ncbi:class II fumarate hydratase [Dasania sp. GY-MA-18]|uniref:Fumarate hydratase class II n=1 Tax=Dasania phycosphaerae TaxID=2950436 RepID=A0A9J6RL09_9GAMM|nr:MULTISPECIES: class II fumarate hydratase [Dasania]MCR8922588.1 class II fumarate hydratase [Dasania sp. GY-MA-18]MCZ0865017.1 class II fumarate hydratase [Dasania phycosphaerae]MCZ0868744.1 class II fumarate hydratase [Dasania phycosphaerae]
MNKDKTNTTPQYRSEQDSMGEVQIPADALYGPQTQRAINNFTLSDLRLPRSFIRALGLVKKACAAANSELGLLDETMAKAIQQAASEVAKGKHDSAFAVDVFQTGSGTSSNMNANEVIAKLASAKLKLAVHPNNHVNMGQSSNDVIPTCIHVSASLAIAEQLLPNLAHLMLTLEQKGQRHADTVKTGRTHLMDAMPITLKQELDGWAAQLQHNAARIGHNLHDLQHLAIGGTAVGSGINTHPQFGKEVAEQLQLLSGQAFTISDDYFAVISSQDSAVAMSGELKTLAVSLMKISNDLRWMNSGPLSGLAEITLPELQPGSSIMPGKINPVIPEAVAMACAQVIGNDSTITVAGQSGNFQLNVMLPVIAYNLLQSIELLSNAMRALADQAVSGFNVNHEKLSANLSSNPILVTALNEKIGYDLGAAIAKRAYQEQRPVIDVAEEMTDYSREVLSQLLDPKKLTCAKK